MFPGRRGDARRLQIFLDMFLLFHANQRRGDAWRRADELQGALGVGVEPGKSLSDDRRQVSTELALQNRGAAHHRHAEILGDLEHGMAMAMDRLTGVGQRLAHAQIER